MGQVVFLLPILQTHCHLLAINQREIFVPVCGEYFNTQLYVARTRAAYLLAYYGREGARFRGEKTGLHEARSTTELLFRYIARYRGGLSFYPEKSLARSDRRRPVLYARFEAKSRGGDTHVAYAVSNERLKYESNIKSFPAVAESAPFPTFPTRRPRRLHRSRFRRN